MSATRSTAVIAEIFVQELISYILYFMLKVQTRDQNVLAFGFIRRNKKTISIPPILNDSKEKWDLCTICHGIQNSIAMEAILACQQTLSKE